MMLVQTGAIEAGHLRWQHGPDGPALGGTEGHVRIVPVDAPCVAPEDRPSFRAGRVCALAGKPAPLRVHHGFFELRP